MPKRFSRGWLLACMIACVNAHPSGRDGRQAGGSSLGALAAASDYDFDDLSAEGYVGKTNDPSGEESETAGVSSTSPRNKNTGSPLLPEPDAEMLPAHYTGVKPPGVDHMEIIFIDSASLGTDLKSSLADGAALKSSAGGAAVSGSEVSGGGDDEGGRRGVSFERRAKGEEGEEVRKGEYAESAGKKKAREEAEGEFNGREDETTGEEDARLRLERRRENDRKAAGYHNVFHKDEYKKDADFYGNDHAGGRFQKHGRYDEKHTAVEGDFRKGAGGNAGFAAAGTGESGKFEQGRKDEEANGRVGQYGREVRFSKFDEFAKKSAGDGQSFGNLETGVKVR